MPLSPHYAQLDLIASPVFVLEIDAEGQPVYAAFNKKARSVSGRPLSDYLGRTAKEVYVGPFGRAAYERHCQARDSVAPLVYQVDLPIADRTRTIQTTLHPEKDAHGKLQRLYGTSIDLTAQTAAQQAKEEFEALTNEMEQFVALAAHDLRTPMRNISAIADLLLDEFVDRGDGKVELIETLDKIAIKTSELITDVLSHVESVRAQSKASTFSFPALCYDILGALDPLSQHKVKAATVTMRADRTAMQIVLRNLTENAMKHGGRKKLSLDIDVQKGLPGMIDVTLSDNGGGFSKDGLELMNGGRFRAESGYGLFAVKRLIDARGGTLVARNLPDSGGAVVRFSLPGDCINSTMNLGGLPFGIESPPVSFPLTMQHRA
ncbi:Histidine kinase [Sulfitobacter noctilucicola]|uniref:histidine kinase n=1 Tax=Sulfitobacter noctilucicola TaxID=1342301 RepID=A0A7W6M8I4_9RHOB|nr:PAS domain-containing sensor histidine kinase [Sulfitobacter noctilucicola]KIN64737.1 Histidine kinase [Sulfitobacter noctilucicola]MBB4174117.1 hypothetical protein [Sulfitobacter noctilucicola]